MTIKVIEQLRTPMQALWRTQLHGGMGCTLSPNRFVALIFLHGAVLCRMVMGKKRVLILPSPTSSWRHPVTLWTLCTSAMLQKLCPSPQKVLGSLASSFFLLPPFFSFFLFSKHWEWEEKLKLLRWEGKTSQACLSCSNFSRLGTACSKRKTRNQTRCQRVFK